METIHQILQESVNGGFWKFVGYWIIIALILSVQSALIAYTINTTLRHWTMRKHGYPPEWCDSDGDFRKEKKDED